MLHWSWIRDAKIRILARPDLNMPTVDNSVVIRNSWVFTGPNSDAAVLNLRENDLPLVFIYEGNFGPNHGSLIVSKIDIDANIKELCVRCSSRLEEQFRYKIEPNLQNVHEWIPERLRPFVKFS